MTQLTLLAFDTSAAHCAAALLHDGTMVTRVDDMARGQAEHLMPMLEDVLTAARLDWSMLDAIGVGIGPGNFTGIRIAVSAARGLALGLRKPAFGVSNFEAQAHGLARPVTAALPAPRGTYYAQTFTQDGPSAPVQGDAPAFHAPILPPDEMIAHIALIAASRIGTDQPRPAPLYVRAADAAPSKDAPPVILT